MADIVQLGYDVETSQVEKGDKALDSLTTSTVQADAAQKKLAKTSLSMGTQMGVASKQANNLNQATNGASRQGLRNMGLQLNQVAQQGAVTGNYMQALAIQMPDLLLGFGGVGIAAGIAAGALGPMALSLLQGADASNELADALDDVNNLAGSIDSTIDLLQSSTDDLAETYGLAADRVRQFGVTLAQSQIAQASSRLNDLSFSLNTVTEAFQDVLRDTRDNVFTSVALRDALGVTQDQLISIAEAFREVDTASGLSDQQDALLNLLDTLSNSNVEVAKLPPELRSVVSELLSVSNEADRAAESMRILAAEASNVNVSGFGSVPNVGDANLLPTTDTDAELAKRNRGGTDPYEQNLNRLVESLQTERETLEIWYADSEQLLLDHRSRQYLTEEEHREALLSLEEEYQSRKAAMDTAVAQHEIKARESVFNSASGLLGALAGESRAAAIAQIALNKGLAIAQTIQNTAVAEIRAFAELGPIHGIPAAAKIAAYGKANIGVIAATGLAQATSLGGSSGSSGDSSSGASGGTVSASGSIDELPTRRVALDFNGAPDWVSAMFEDITSRIQEGSDTGVIYEISR